MRIAFLALASLLSAATGAFAQAPDFKGTVNQVTDAQESRAKAAIVGAGYQPTVLEFAQDGNLFYTATRNGELFEATVTPAGKVYVSTGLPETPSSRS